MQEEPKKQVYSMYETAKILGTDVHNVYEFQKAGILHCIKIRSLKVSQKEIDRFIDWAQDKDLTDPWNVKEIDCGVCGRTEAR